MGSPQGKGQAVNERASQGVCQGQFGLKAGPPETCLGHRKGVFLLSYIIGMEVALTWSFQLQQEGGGGENTHTAAAFPTLSISPEQPQWLQTVKRRKEASEIAWADHLPPFPGILQKVVTPLCAGMGDQGPASKQPCWPLVASFWGRLGPLWLSWVLEVTQTDLALGTVAIRVGTLGF